MRCPPRSDLRTGDDGAVTVEAALALGTLVVVTAGAVAAVAAVATAVRCTDAARELVRQAARGDTDRGRSAAAALAPSGSGIELRFDGDTAVAVVTARPAGPLPIRISGSAAAVTEPGLAPDGTAGGDPGTGPTDPAPAPGGGDLPDTVTAPEPSGPAAPR